MLRREILHLFTTNNNITTIKRQNKNMKHTYELTKKLGESYGIQLEAYAMQDAHANEFRVMNEEYPRKLFFMGKY